MIRVQVPATTANLGPGFDCLGMALELYNIVEIIQVPHGLTIEVTGEGAADISRDVDNLVFRAAQQVFKQVGFEPTGLKIRLINQIPVARGLGSSTAAIIGGVIAANLLVGGRLSLKEIIGLASLLEGHPDNVAPAVLGGIVISVQADGELKNMKIQPPQGIKCVVAIPDFILATKASRDVLPSQVPFQDVIFNLGRVALLVAALQKGDFTLLGTAMEDHLHQPFRSVLVPGMKKVLAAAKLAGARGVTLSGAGPSVIALADSNFDLIARVMGDTFRQNGVKCRTLVLKPSPIGARALEVK
ncbi:homoserine kinase [Pelotomaculum terephthalicicum JT]|uniref:homoserine kinase n=1 Tax=Pelotomaculum TaxID=191373 RepID=UPI0009CA8E2C|nr:MULTISPECIES: homoserine kinase [Pelotomaculum]MCG9967690.1 homoserine kinase [Pelotomaculum terephthalicicum JT]OPX84016.1 MAG: Homoserine kinase [Pelotomaculum sp. PtaB.Bin117]